MSHLSPKYYHYYGDAWHHDAAMIHRSSRKLGDCSKIQGMMDRAKYREEHLLRITHRASD